LRETVGRVVASGAREHQIAIVTVANQKFFRAPARFDFLATGRENGGGANGGY
jgi:hypothetical protein